jgi:hypothetical protein
VPVVVTAWIGQHQAEVAQINERLAEVEQGLTATRSRAINRDHLAQNLAQFTGLWDVLYPMERVELVRSLIECVTYHDATDDIQIRFKSRS